MIIIDGKPEKSYMFDTPLANALTHIHCNMTKTDRYGGSFIGQLPVVEPCLNDTQLSVLRKERGRGEFLIYYIFETGEVVIPLNWRASIRPFHATPYISFGINVDERVKEIEIIE